MSDIDTRLNKAFIKLDALGEGLSALASDISDLRSMSEGRVLRMFIQSIFIVLAVSVLGSWMLSKAFIA